MARAFSQGRKRQAVTNAMWWRRSRVRHDLDQGCKQACFLSTEVFLL